MNNKDKYKSAIDQIHVREDLKQKTLNNISKKKSRIVYLKYLSSIAAIALFAVIGVIAYNNHFEDNLDVKKTNKNIIVAKTQVSDLKRIDNMQELRNILEEQEENSRLFWGASDTVDTDISLFDNIDTSIPSNNDSIGSKDINDLQSIQAESESLDYSKTNTQVENVDEADIIKTDGNYIYCVSQGVVYIIKSDNLEEVSTIKFDDDFSVSQLYLKDDRLVVLGNLYYTEVRVYDISDRKQPKEFRKVALEGYYVDSRMIGDNIYFISSHSLYLRKTVSNCDDSELLPRYKDSKLLIQEQYVDCTDIAYFENTNDYSYTMVAGFNIMKKDDVSVETFLGAGYSEVYASEENLYLVMPEYNNGYIKEDSKIYKFSLNNGEVILKCKGSVPGYVDDQFSIDEYKGNLRIATTISVVEKDNKLFNRSYTRNTTTQLTILDENLNKIGEIEDLAYGEEIYSVRFMGEIGYIVTFEEVDPLFVIDLSNPREPKVKGELKIPGYSSYLHMYDDTHVIGIGYNTKDNGYGGVRNDSMKMSMFDVSDLTNPIEMFSIDIGEGYTYSEIISNHKALFFNKNKNLIGFPVQDYEKGINGFMFYKIDLKDGFKPYDDLMNKDNYFNNVRRAIYIDDILYILTNNKLMSYDLNTFESIGKIEF